MVTIGCIDNSVQNVGICFYPGFEICCISERSCLQEIKTYSDRHKEKQVGTYMKACRTGERLEDPAGKIARNPGIRQTWAARTWAAGRLSRLFQSHCCCRHRNTPCIHPLSAYTVAQDSKSQKTMPDCWNRNYMASSGKSKGGSGPFSQLCSSLDSTERDFTKTEVGTNKREVGQ